MKKHSSYPSIDQLRQVVSSVNRHATFCGLDINGDAIYNPNAKKPSILFTGTVKLHGTNGSVMYNNVDGFWVQSRERIITIQDDNAGCAFFCEGKKDIFVAMIQDIATKNNIDLNQQTIGIFFEWAGSGIQKGVAINNIEKSVFIFGIKICQPGVENFVSYWLDCQNYRSIENRIYNIYDYKTYQVEIDFNMPQLSQNTIVDMTMEVEKECPVGKAFGYSGVGEGIVFSGLYDGKRYTFKSKGKQHSVSHVKTIAAIDTEKLNNIVEFVNYAVTENRFDQAIEKIYGSKDKIDITKLGEFLKWFISDIMKEETDVLLANNIEPKEVGKYISSKAREMFFETYNNM